MGKKWVELNQTFQYPIASGWDRTTDLSLSKWQTVTEAIKLLRKSLHIKASAGMKYILVGLKRKVVDRFRQQFVYNPII
ncbi:hypothetical protein HMPREF1013_00169 [Bacillus sp. 2_A_57_CT2]|nr:hypothetical protein HMPREF1013_00169 [Bacillus sp. 2_A_57_CT2]